MTESNLPKKPRRPRVRERIVSQDDGEGNWLMSYADMMTLLFGFFVMLSVMSTPNAEKVEKLRQVTSQSMGVKFENPYESLNNSLKDLLKGANLEGDVKIEVTLDGIRLISRGTLFFASGSSQLNPAAEELVSRISHVLVDEAKGFQVIVEGHTDDSPMVSRQFPSNWELASSRAGTVVRLLEEKGFPHNKLRPIGLADTDPVVPNRDAAGTPIADNQAMNRRIVIQIKKPISVKP